MKGNGGGVSTDIINNKHHTYKDNIIIVCIVAAKML